MTRCHGLLGPQNGSDLPSALGLVDRALVVAVVVVVVVVVLVVVVVVACWPTHRRSSPIAIARLGTADIENIPVLLIL